MTAHPPTISYTTQTRNPAHPIVFFDVTLGGEPLGRIKMELFSTIVPKTAENFRQLCTGESKGNTGKPQGFKGCKFHRVACGTCIYGSRYFPDENFTVKHDVPGVLSMANSGPNTNGSQFFITCAATSFLDNKHVVFGKVITDDGGESMKVVKKIENCRTILDRPTTDVVITQCGEM